MADHFAADTARIEPGEIFFHARCEQRNVRDLAKMFGDKPDRFVSCHPIKMVEAGQIHRTRVATQRALESQIEINIEIAHCQLAERAINRLAITAAGEVGLGERAPMSAHFKNRDYVIGVLLRFQIEDERRKAKDAKGGRSKNSTLETRCGSFVQNMYR